VSGIRRDISYSSRTTAGRQQVLLPAISWSFITYSGITTIYYRKTKGHIFTKNLETEGTTQKARIIAAVKNIDAPMLTLLWQELEYRINVFRVTRGAHMEHL